MSRIRRIGDLDSSLRSKFPKKDGLRAFQFVGTEVDVDDSPASFEMIGGTLIDDMGIGMSFIPRPMPSIHIP